MMLGLVDDVALDPLNLTWADGLSPISAQRTSIFMISPRREKVAKAAAELLDLRFLTMSLTACVGHIPSSTCIVIHSRPRHNEPVLHGRTHFQSLAFDNWG